MRLIVIEGLKLFVLRIFLYIKQGNSRLSGKKCLLPYFDCKLLLLPFTSIFICIPKGCFGNRSFVLDDKAILDNTYLI